MYVRMFACTYLAGEEADRRHPTTAEGRAAPRSPPFQPSRAVAGRQIPGCSFPRIQSHVASVGAMMYTDSFDYNRAYILSSRMRVQH